MELSAEQTQRYSRHLVMKELGVSGQEKLRKAKVLIIGAGGLGSPAALYLAAAGIGSIGIADGDRVELSNLQRQILHSTADIGRPKVDSTRESLERLNPDVQVKTHPGPVNAGNIMELIAAYDFILECTDNFPAKFLINDACVLSQKPFCHGSVIRFFGQVMTYVPGQGPCYRCVFKSPPPQNAVPAAKQAGVIGAAAGMIGCLQALEAIKYITGAGDLLTGRLLTFDALDMDFQKISLQPDPDCPVCGPKPAILKPFDCEQPL